MKRIVVCLLAAVMLLASAAGCAGQPKGEPVDVTQAVSELQKKVAFDDPMTAVEEDTALALYGLEKGDVEEIAAVLSTGATAEEIAVIKAADGKTAKCKEALAQRIQKQKDGFEDYVPAEVPKLERACLMEKDNVVILCVAKDADTAKKVVQEILGA